MNTPWHRSESQKPTEADLPIETYCAGLVHPFAVLHELLTDEYDGPDYHWRPYRPEPPSEPTAEERDWAKAKEILDKGSDDCDKLHIPTSCIERDVFDGIQWGREQGAKAERERLWKLVQTIPLYGVLLGNDVVRSAELRAIFAEGE